MQGFFFAESKNGEKNLMKCADGVKNKIRPLFAGFYDSLMFSYFDGVFGTAFCDDTTAPTAAVICCGDFYFAAGDKSCAADMLTFCSDNKNAVIVPDSEELAKTLCAFDGQLKIVKRYHTCPPENGFDTDRLRETVSRVRNIVQLKLSMIDKDLYEKALAEQWSESFVCNFKDFADFSAHGFGYVLTDNGRIVSGTSTFSYYDKGVEIEVSTREEYRLKGLAQITAAAFLLECVRRGLTPHWDARNLTSLSIAQKMGFVFRDEYIALEYK